MTTRQISLFLFAALLSVAAFIACKDDAPAPTPAPAAESSAHKFGLNVNNLNEVATVVVETGVAEWPKAAADSTAEAGTSETSFGLIGPGPAQITIALCQFHTNSTLTTSTTSFATLNVYKRNQLQADGGTTQTLIATANTEPVNEGGTGSWSAFQNVSIPAVAGAYVAPGDALTVSIVKTGVFGALVPQGQLACFTTIN